MKYEKLAEKISNSRFAGHVRQSQHKKEVFDEKNILIDVSSGTRVAEYGLPPLPLTDLRGQTLANEYYSSYFGADPKEVAGIIEELEKRKPELVHREVGGSSQTIEVDEFYKDENRIVEIKKGYVIDKGVRYEGYGPPKEYSLENGMDLVHLKNHSKKEMVKDLVIGGAGVVSGILAFTYPPAIVLAGASCGYLIKKIDNEDARIRAIEKRAKVIHSPT